MEQPITDFKNRKLNVGDLVQLVDDNGLDNDDVQHKKGDIFYYIGGLDDNMGAFIHCKYNKRTDFFADRTLKIKQLN